MKVLITGGCGFIGTNVAIELAKAGHTVVALDNLARKGSDENIPVLLKHKVRVRTAPCGLYHINNDPFNGDVQEESVKSVALALVGERPDAVVHLAGQTAATYAEVHPGSDFMANAYGSLAVLQACAHLGNPAMRVVVASTNKVYGDEPITRLKENATRWWFADEDAEGVDESQPFAPAGFYGQSKGVLDSYAREYRAAGLLATCVLRLSGVYGRYQHGTTDQGWLNWFARLAMRHEQCTIYGDGKQVRDVLHAEDLARLARSILEGKNDPPPVMNVGGGKKNTLSIWELHEVLGRLGYGTIVPEEEDWRRGDQKLYVSDIGLARSTYRWEPRITPELGVRDMVRWMKSDLRTK